MGGRVVVDVRRLAGEEEALLERTGQIFPRRGVPRKRTWVIRLQLEAISGRRLRLTADPNRATS
jgi:hypothetical protein